MRRLLALVALVLAGSIGNAQATTITFEDHAVAPGTALPQTGDLTSGGFFFDNPAGNGYQLANNSAAIDNGSSYLVTQGTPSQTTFSQIGGAPFALTSIDYAEWQVDIGGFPPSAHTITVTGNKVGGTSVSATLSLDGIFNGPGPDFQTFAFGSQWTNLSSVVLLGTGATFGNLNYFAIDNVVVDIAAVPEPGTLSLLGLGSAYLFGRRRRSRR
jgi:PEP-CTERM motif